MGGNPFLESLDLPLGSELEEWVYGTREYLAGRFRNVLLQLAEREVGKGNLSQATKYAERAYTLTGAPELEPDDIKRLYIFIYTVLGWVHSTHPTLLKIK